MAIAISRASMHRAWRCCHGASGMLALVLANAAASAMPATPPAAPRVRVAAGVIEGKLVQVDEIALRAFHGIPYAAAPLAALRWKPPQPLAPWDGSRLAQGFGPRCMQQPLFGDMVFRANGMSEDCLYLNVWTPAQLPASSAAQKLPVLVYFYGGGFVAGDGSEPRYDGARLATLGCRLDPCRFAFRRNGAMIPRVT